MSDPVASAVELALDFVEALVERRYEDAFALTAADFTEEGGERLDVDALRSRFELIVPHDWVFTDMEAIYAASPPPPHLMPKHMRGPLAIMEPDTDWVEEPDVAFLYVGIADGAEGEGVSFFVAHEGDRLVVREISFGRP